MLEAGACVLAFPGLQEICLYSFKGDKRMKNKQTRILIVDDDPGYAEGISILLESEGYFCDAVNDAKAAIKILDNKNFEILLVDWQMPEMSGVELIERIRSHPDHRQKYIIMVSGKGALEDKVAGMDVGANDYLVKPFESQELLARIRAAIRILELEKELIEQERRSTVLEMALSITDKIGNPLSAACFLQQNIHENAQDYKKVKQSIDDLGTALLEIQELLKKYQSIKNPKTIPAAMGKRMIDPESEK
jgi:DNA-binding response OmpR family regulator